MSMGILFRAESTKPLDGFLQAVREKASQFGFSIRRVFDMGKMYREQGVDAAEDFRVYSVLLCNFERSYRSIRKNSERAAVLLEPRQIVAHDRTQRLTVNYLPFPKDFIREALPEDESFADSLSESCQRIIELIKTCV